MRRRKPKTECRHFLVGASNLELFLRGGFDFEKAHSVFKTTIDNKIVGNSGEQTFINFHQKIKSMQPFGIHRRFPWLCSKADFIVEEDEREIIVEIKTFGDYSRATAAHRKPCKRTILQLWLQLEIFNLKYGRILTYFF